MKIFRFEGALHSISESTSKWLSPAYIQVDSQGRIQKLSDSPISSVDNVIHVNGYAIPGIFNGHSHAFQYAMAGATEHLPTQAKKDDFWSWRKEMYKLALSISPEQMFTIASYLYAKMLQYGYTHVAEFHYLHHDIDGKPYTDAATMGKTLMDAARHVGMHITLIPVYYQNGGFDKPSKPEQRRFVFKNIDQYLQLCDDLRSYASQSGAGSVGYGIHSLRAASQDTIKELTRSFATDAPIHIHIAEQKKEVRSCKAAWGKRPVEWLLHNIDIDHHWHLVHATHLTKLECEMLIASEAHVVLCPTTEANLGDGLFPLTEYVNLNGKFSIGSDSHIGINPFEELRLLDYGQRLFRRKRNPLCKPSEHSGNLLLMNAWKYGNLACGNSYSPFFTINAPLNCIVIDSTIPGLAKDENFIDHLVFAAESSCITATITNGELVVENGFHKDYKNLSTQYRNWKQ